MSIMSEIVALESLIGNDTLEAIQAVFTKCEKSELTDKGNMSYEKNLLNMLLGVLSGKGNGNFTGYYKPQ